MCDNIDRKAEGKSLHLYFLTGLCSQHAVRRLACVMSSSVITKHGCQISHSVSSHHSFFNDAEFLYATIFNLV